jgi:hypothetical protein
MAELGYGTGNTAVAAFYGELLDGLLVDLGDRDVVPPKPGYKHSDSILMTDAVDRERVGRRCLEILRGISR